jgi:hypothetical protein
MLKYCMGLIVIDQSEIQSGGLEEELKTGIYWLNRHQWPAVAGAATAVLSIIDSMSSVFAESAERKENWRKLLMKTTSLLLLVGLPYVYLISKGQIAFDLGQQAIADDINDG